MTHRLPSLALIGLGLAVSFTSAESSAETCTPVHERDRIDSSQLKAGDRARAPLEIMIAGDTQLQSPKGGQALGLTGRWEDRLVNVSIRPLALRLLGETALYILLDDAIAAHGKPDVILYLGDGANNGCTDEIESLERALEKIREQHEVPIFILPGNHDYLGNGNSNDETDRGELCTAGNGGTNPILSKAEVLEKFLAFNKKSGATYSRRWRYESHEYECKREPHDEQRDCHLAAVLHDCGADAEGTCTADAAQRVIRLVDTSDYFGNTPFLDDLRGSSSGISEDQRIWFEDNDPTGEKSRPLHRIVASHYAIDADDPLRCVDEDCSAIQLWAHSHTPLPCQTHTDGLRLNVGSTTDLHAQVARVHVDDAGVGRWAPYFLFEGMVGRLLGKRVSAKEKLRATHCEAFIEGLRVDPQPPWRVRPVAGRTSGLGIYGLDQGYRDFAWSEDDEQAATANLANLMAWWTQEAILRDRDTIIGQSLTARVAEMRYDAAAPPANGPWPLDDLVACLAETAATIEGEGDRPVVPFTFPMDSYLFRVRPAFDIRLGNMPGAGRADEGPAFIGQLDSRFEWRRTTAFDIDLRATRLGDASAADWQARLDRFTAESGGRSSSAVWRFVGGRTDLELGHGDVLDRRTWLMNPPRFDGGEFQVHERDHGFGMRVGLYEASADTAPDGIGDHRLAIGSLEWCPRRADPAHPRESIDPGKPRDPLDQRAVAGRADQCGSSEELGGAVGIDVVMPMSSDGQRRITDLGLRGALEWADANRMPALRLDLGGHLQLDDGLMPGTSDMAYQFAGRITGWVETGAGRLAMMLHTEWFTSTGNDDFDPFRLLYGRRHLRFGGSDRLADPHLFVDDGTAQITGARIALQPPRKYVPIDLFEVGVGADWLQDVSVDLSADLHLRFRTGRVAVLYGWHRLHDSIVEGTDAEQTAHSVLVTAGGSM